MNGYRWVRMSKEERDRWLEEQVVKAQIMGLATGLVFIPLLMWAIWGS